MNHLFSHKAGNQAYRLFFIIAAFLVTVSYDIFFWEKENGINLLLFTGLYTAIFLTIIILTGHFKEKKALLLLIPTFILAFDYSYYNNEFISNIGIPLSILLLGLFSILATLEIPKNKFYLHKITIFKKLFFPVLESTRMALKDLSFNKENESVKYKKIVIGFLISLPLLLIFTVLFATADAVFADLFTKLEKLQSTDVWRVLRLILLFIITSGFFYTIIRKDHILHEKKYLIEKFDITTVNTILTLLNVLFLVFVFIQFKYLFGSYEYVLDNQMVFSEYARKGFWQLIFASGLAGLIFLVTYRSFAFHGNNIYYRIVNGLFLVQTGVIAVSALRRINVYQEAYGYTVSRLFVEWGIYLIIALLVLGIVTIIINKNFKFLIQFSLLICLVWVTIISSVNIDYTIANKNINLYKDQGKELDLNYLKKLSVDALPAILAIENGKVKKSEDYQEIINKNKKEIEKHDEWLEYNFGTEPSNKIQVTNKS